MFFYKYVACPLEFVLLILGVLAHFLVIGFAISPLIRGLHERFSHFLGRQSN